MTEARARGPGLPGRAGQGLGRGGGAQKWERRRRGQGSTAGPKAKESTWMTGPGPETLRNRGCGRSELAGWVLVTGNRTQLEWVSVRKRDVLSSFTGVDLESVCVCQLQERLDPGSGGLYSGCGDPPPPPLSTSFHVGCHRGVTAQRSLLPSLQPRDPHGRERLSHSFSASPRAGSDWTLLDPTFSPTPGGASDLSAGSR